MAIGTGAAILGGAILGGGASLLAGGAQSDAAGNASSLVAQATQDAIAEQRRQFDLAYGDLEPYRNVGQNALGQYAALWGIGTSDPNDNPEFLDEQYQTGTESYWTGGGGGAYTGANLDVSQSDLIGGGGLVSLGGGGGGGWGTRPTYGTRQVENPDYDPNGGLLSAEEMQAARDRFKETPGYTFRFDEGLRAIDRSASARGRLGSGGLTRELTRYGQGIASEEFNNYANRLAGLAAGGQGAAVTSGNQAIQTGGNIANTINAGSAQQSDLLLAAGTARASGFAGVGNAASGAAGNFLTLQQLQGQGATPGIN